VARAVAATLATAAAVVVVVVVVVVVAAAAAAEKVLQQPIRLSVCNTVSYVYYKIFSDPYIVIEV
jgi:hypothetical protein